MTEELKAALRQDIRLFEEKLRAFEAGEMDKGSYKGFSGGYGSYAQRGGGNMLRLRMTGGRLDKEKLAYLADSVERYHIDRVKLTTCQTVQLHDLSARATVELMRAAIDAGIYTRGGGGDFPRNVMVSPLSGVERGEYFDVLPWAEGAADYLLAKTRRLRLPRKLKVAFSNGPDNVTHATFRDLGFAARSDGRFDVYCAGGLGPNPKLGVEVAGAIQPEDILACIDAMIAVFTAFGNYENRGRARARYLQETLGEDGLKAEFGKALKTALGQSPKLSRQPRTLDKAADGAAEGPRVIPQKQAGLYAVSYHPLGGNLAPEKPRALYELVRDMPQAELRIAPGGALYLINLTGREAQAALAATGDGAGTPFEASVCCIGASICQQGLRDSQALLSEMIAAVREAGLPGHALPSVHVSGCLSSCGAHQIGTLGLQGCVKLVDKTPQPAFNLLVFGEERQGGERLGQTVGAMLQKDIPGFMVELGRAVAASGQPFEAWLGGHREELLALAGRYIG